ncbi:hypothetical protein JGK46_001462 [Aeromonas bestiarum]|nr:hypothetical protein [Aeromonas bestiarum]
MTTYGDCSGSIKNVSSITWCKTWMDGWMMALLHLDSHTQQQEEEDTDKEETKKARRLDGLA